ncbi:hypothetical protein PIB30_008686 [Stylosanthes scabra]|uniref:Uncharacterized protein n=1 Tax=Stylosanthes scabra TaxID=79078 RepID=A0ABU6T4V4_9FABA|nr:hypothetical protein [Stylosanthes scabra]
MRAQSGKTARKKQEGKEKKLEDDSDSVDSDTEEDSEERGFLWLQRHKRKKLPPNLKRCKVEPATQLGPQPQPEPVEKTVESVVAKVQEKEIAPEISKIQPRALGPMMVAPMAAQAASVSSQKEEYDLNKAFDLGFGTPMPQQQPRVLRPRRLPRRTRKLCNPIRPTTSE